MERTSLTLLGRLQQDGADDDWQLFVALYRPFISRFIRLDRTLAADAEDICQEVLAKAAEHLPKFERRREGSFRNWLKTITVNQVRQFFRRRQSERGAIPRDGRSALECLLEPNDPLSQQWDRQYASYLLCRLQELVCTDFSATTWEAFRLRVLEGKTTAEVAAELSMSRNAVDVAKSRVLARLRREAADLLDD